MGVGYPNSSLFILYMMMSLIFTMCDYFYFYSMQVMSYDERH